uniref:DUF695 domain-containing protein n=1 Tax=Rhabditophanes sp. KR3021 TaxID=114890 RepID=A0AC35TSE5_9BILA
MLAHDSKLGYKVIAEIGENDESTELVAKILNQLKDVKTDDINYSNYCSFFGVGIFSKNHVRERSCREMRLKAAELNDIPKDLPKVLINEQFWKEVRMIEELNDKP